MYAGLRLLIKIKTDVYRERTDQVSQHTSMSMLRSSRSAMKISRNMHTRSKEGLEPGRRDCISRVVVVGVVGRSGNSHAWGERAWGGLG